MSIEYEAANAKISIEERRKRVRLRAFLLKKRAILLLGGKCVGCGEDDLRVLQINHLKGGGRKDGFITTGLYRAIIKGIRSKDDLDVRCANCNIIYEYERGRLVDRRLLL